MVQQQGGEPGLQGHVAGNHGVDGLQPPPLLLWSWGDPHVIIVDGRQHDQEDGAGGVAVRGSCMLRLWSHCIAVNHFSEDACPLQGRSVFPLQKVSVWCDVGGVWVQLCRRLCYQKAKARDVIPRVKVNGLGCVCCVRAVRKCAGLGRGGGVRETW